MNWVKNVWTPSGTSLTSNAITAQENVACYPDDIPFEDGPCNDCDNPCTTHKQTLDKVPSNWPPKLEESEGSLAAMLDSIGKSAGQRLGYRVLMTAVEVPVPSSGSAEPLLRKDEVLILPDLVAVGPVTTTDDSHGRGLEEYLVTGEAPAWMSVRSVSAWKNVNINSSRNPGSAEALSSAENEADNSGGLTACILVCAHKLRDKRCGVAGPMLIESLQHTCLNKGLQEKVVVLACSHIGGHKFAGNIIVYSDLGGHWYGRVKPCHSDAIIDTHVVGGKVFKELWRGRMDV
ncbi:hypothetical protein CEUSTIGMA_g3676.t1 [Chlamydomonas eustigma]|uniref:Uncharacterized protein n=1 Tax=Chlamydomonas eustigma TaxID=1157962 RepID=A0A250X017_9CHLO|nr:hypothetical protein CEUSTIGMA_g3676.t1 [Chlamydomonas eustigma]|eukprot:GAX76232.1 hypothetical protein CEUSTIGMA_g3676.t1 [Chlamydomonas eustigma]